MIVQGTPLYEVKEADVMSAEEFYDGALKKGIMIGLGAAVCGAVVVLAACKLFEKPEKKTIYVM